MEASTNLKRQYDQHTKSLARVNPKILSSIQELCKVWTASVGLVRSLTGLCLSKCTPPPPDTNHIGHCRMSVGHSMHCLSCVRTARSHGPCPMVIL